MYGMIVQKYIQLPHNNMTELYFEDNDIEGIIEKLESGKENCFGLNNREDEDIPGKV